MAERPFRFLNIAADSLSPHIKSLCFNVMHERLGKSSAQDTFLSDLIKRPIRIKFIIKTFFPPRAVDSLLEPLEAVALLVRSCSLVFLSYGTIYRELERTILAANTQEDLKWFSNNHGPGMHMNWPAFEVRRRASTQDSLCLCGVPSF